MAMKRELADTVPAHTVSSHKKPNFPHALTNIDVILKHVSDQNWHQRYVKIDETYRFDDKQFRILYISNEGGTIGGQQKEGRFIVLSQEGSNNNFAVLASIVDTLPIPALRDKLKADLSTLARQGAKVFGKAVDRLITGNSLHGEGISLKAFNRYHDLVLGIKTARIREGVATSVSDVVPEPDESYKK